MYINNPIISVIVPIYNVEHYLDRCIKSILNQTYKNLEVILVDDGSPDNCPQKCDEWALLDDRIRVIHKENGGLGSARNAGLKICKGDYVSFVDSDDWISCDMYETLLDVFSKENNVSIAVGKIVKTNTEKIKEKDSCNEYTIFSQDEYARKFFRIDSNEPVLYVVNKLYTIEVARKIHFPEGVIDEDVQGFFTALVNSKNIAVVNKDVYYYWRNPEGISYKWFSHKQMDLLTVWNNVVVICENRKSEWIDYAKLNYYRANMGLLIRLSLNEKKEDSQFFNEQQYLIMELKKRKKELLKAQFPISRKVLIVMFCFDYKLTRNLIRVGQKLVVVLRGKYEI